MHCILFEKAERLSGIFLAEVYEGTTYESAVGLTTITETDIEAIPAKPCVIDDDSFKNYTKDDVVIFDLETTGLGTASSKESSIF